MKLTNKSCQHAKPMDKPYKLADGGGLYLYVQKDGSRYWRVKYYYLGKEKLLSFGVYPAISLAEARDKRDAAKKRLANGKVKTLLWSKRQKNDLPFTNPKTRLKRLLLNGMKSKKTNGHRTMH